MAKRSAVRKGRPPTYPELGYTGLRHWGGWVREEFLGQLQGQRGMRIFREMRDNSAVVGACLGAVEMLLRQVRWYMDPATSATEDKAVADFVDTCRHDMSHTWEDFISEVLSFFCFGYSYHELVYKQRRGDRNDPKLRSKFNDGRIGWRKMPTRAQETTLRWDIDDEGGIQGMVQQGPPKYQTVLIPIDKALLFRAKAEKNNPEGRSILRNAYFSWYFSKKLAEIEAIGVSRDLNGLPVMWIPAECFLSGATSDQKAVKAMAEKIVRDMCVDEQGGLVLPLSYDATSGSTPMPRYKLELLASAGRRQHDTDAIINRYDRRIAMSIMFDLVMMGAPNTLTYKGKNMPQFFAVSLDGWADAIASVINAHAIPRLLRLNGIPLERAPKLKHGEIVAPDLAALGDYITKLAGVGMPLFDDDWSFLRRVAGMRAAPTGQPALLPDPDGPEDPPSPDNEGGGADSGYVTAARAPKMGRLRKVGTQWLPYELGELAAAVTELRGFLEGQMEQVEKRTRALPAPDGESAP